MNKKYPTKKDIKKHTQEVVVSMKQYLLGFDKKADFVRNAFNSLFADLILDLKNLKDLDGIMIEDLRFNTFIKKMGDTKHLKKNFENYVKRSVIENIKK